MKNSHKKLFSGLLAFTLVLTTSAFTLPTLAADPLKGDVNLDGKITPFDASMVLQSVTGKITLTATQELAADVTHDGKITTSDARQILEFTAGIINGFDNVATKITLNKTTLSMAIDKTEQLTVSVEPANVGTSSVTWTSSNPDVATVDYTGKVSTIKPGTTTITAATTNNLTATCTVTVAGNNTVYLSPSNQTSNMYAVGGTSEAIQMRLVGAVVERILKQYGVNVIVAPPSMSITDRANQANSLGVGTYVAIHSNAGGTGKGTEAYYKPNMPSSLALTKSIYNEVSTLTPTPDRGVKNGISQSPYPDVGFAEIRVPKMSCVLVEVEFHDKPDLARWIMSNIEPLGNSVATGILKYLGKI